MNRWVAFTICGVFGLLLLLCGWLIPAHPRAVEPSVLKSAGHNSASLVGRATELAHMGMTAAAQLMARAAQNANLPDAKEITAAIETVPKRFPAAQTWGVSGPGLRAYFLKPPKVTGSNDVSFTDFVVREENRKQALNVLAQSKQPAALAVLQSRVLTNTTTFAPSQSAGGEAFDAAAIITALLLDQQRFTDGLKNDIESATSKANSGGDTDPLEQILLDFLSLGQRLNWGQLVAFVSKMDSAATLHDQASLVRNAGDQLPALFSTVELSGNPKGVAQYINTFPTNGLKDLTVALPFNAGGVRALLSRNHRLYTSTARQTVAEYEPFASVISYTADYCWRTPVFALILKWFLYFGGGFLLAMAAHFGRPRVSALEEPLQVRGIHVAREILFALGFLLVVLFLSEPFLAPESPAAALPFRLRIPTAGMVVQPGNSNPKTSFMDNSKIIPIGLFFVLQCLLYISSIVKLAEIRRQRVGPRMKLRLLENEDHLFDAGLYLGFLGTIVAFILSSLSAKPTFNLMVAYSSTSFGILFVSVFKIFHLRPTRRKLLLEAETEPVAVATTTTAPAPSLASP